MQIIFVHPKLRRARTLNLRLRWVLAAALVFAAMVSGGTSWLSYVAIRHAIETRLPFVQPWIASVAPPASGQPNDEAMLRQKIDALAVKLGQIQARMMRLDIIGSRVASIAGLKPSELPPQLPGRGGPLAGAAPITLEELTRSIDQLASSMEPRIDLLDLVESELVYRNVHTRLLPNSEPLPDGNLGSRFGYRSDPFTRRSALHEGVDFNAPAGTPIVAAGSGVVVFAGLHPSYGNQVDIDHGDGLVTRYAHASRLLVKEGDIVRQGQRIADVGTTGRSTGPHLHFEVRLHDAPQDPLRFLQSAGALGLRLAMQNVGAPSKP